MGWPIWGWFPAEGRHFLLLQNIQPQYGAHLAFCSMGNEVFFPGVNGWSVNCPHATVWCWSCQWVKLYHFFPCVPSWHAQRQLTLVTSHLQRTLISLCFLYSNLRQCIQNDHVCTSAQSVEILMCFSSNITGCILINFRMNVVPLVATTNWCSLILYFGKSSVAVTWIYGVGATLPQLQNVVTVKKWQQ